MEEFGLMGLSRLIDAQSRSISAENPDGNKGAGGMATEGLGAQAARDLGRGWKVSPAVEIQPTSVYTLAAIEGPGVIQHLWFTTPPGAWRELILRIYWDDESTPSVECPLGDFFCSGWNERCHVNSLPVAVNPAGGFNAYWAMPFRSRARITVENLGDEATVLFYQVDYSLTTVDPACAYFHAQWRRSNPVSYGDVHTLVDGVTGRGHYVGTYLAWGTHNGGWWGEGEVKFYLDGDGEYPTICGTGTEDYFGGAWGFVDDPARGYETFSTPFLGFPQVIRPDGIFKSQQRFGLYRWHIPDPVRFHSGLRVTVQALGWRRGGRYLPLQDDVASVAFWYQTEPHAPFPALPGRDGLENI